MHFRSVSGSSLSSPTGSSEDLGGFESTRETIYSALLADVAGNVLCAIMYLSSLSVFLFLVFFSYILCATRRMREMRSSGNSQIIVTDIIEFYELPYHSRKIDDGKR